MPIPTSTPGDITLGLLAGGRATRLGGRDKAWESHCGETLVERTLATLASQHRFAAQLVSANRDLQRYRPIGLTAAPDRVADFPGPLAGIDALLAACATPLLLTVPVDLRTIPPDLVGRLLAVCATGCVARDASGLQPLVTLWPVERARTAVARALAQGERAVHRVIEELALPVAGFPEADFGNLNTPEDFLA